MIAVEVIGRNPKYAWEVVGIYRASNEDKRFLEKTSSPNWLQGNSTNRSIIGAT